MYQAYLDCTGSAFIRSIKGPLNIYAALQMNQPALYPFAGSFRRYFSKLGFWLYLDVILVIDMATSWNIGRNINASFHLSFVLFLVYLSDLKGVFLSIHVLMMINNNHFVDGSHLAMCN